MSSSKSSTLLAIVIVIAVVVGGGIYLTGTIDPAPANELKLPTVPRVEAPQPSPQAPVPVEQTAKITTTQFHPRLQRPSGPALKGPVTGIGVRGAVVDPKSNPVAGVELTLIQDLSPIRGQPKDGASLITTISAADGSYLIENLKLGDCYILQATHPEYAIERRFPIDPSTPSTLVQDIRLDAGAAVFGRVVDRSGKPIEATEILAFESSAAVNQDPQAERIVKSGEDGAYSLEHLRPGLKRLYARKKGFATDGKVSIDLRSRPRQEGIDFVLDPGHTIRGVILDKVSNAPVAGARVKATPMAPPMEASIQADAQATAGGTEDGGDAAGSVPVGEPAKKSALAASAHAYKERMDNDPAFAAVLQRMFVVESAVSAEDGSFELTGLMGASYQLGVQAVGYQPVQGFVAASGSDDVRIAMPRSSRISGIVVDDESGTPLTSFSLSWAHTPDPSAAILQSRQEFDRKDGSFDYVDVRPGTVFLFVTNTEGYAGGRTEAIVIAPEQHVSNVVIRAIRGATIRGMVRSSRGKPVVDAKVTLSSERPPGSPPVSVFEVLIKRSMNAGLGKTTLTDANGAYAIESVLAGYYVIRASHVDYSEADSATFTCPEKGEVEVPEVRLLSGAKIWGVVRGPDGNPDGAAQVTVSSSTPMDPATSFSRTTPTNPDGSYEVTGIKPGSYRVIRTMTAGQVDILQLLKAHQDTSSIIVLADEEARRIDL